MNQIIKWGLLPVLIFIYFRGIGEDNYPPEGPSWKDFWRWFNQ